MEIDIFKVYEEIKDSNLSDDTKSFLIGIIKNKIGIAKRNLMIGEKKKINRSGVVQIDCNSKEEIARFETNKKANITLGNKAEASGISDAVNARNGFHFAYGYLWCHANEWDEMTEEERKEFE